jgi:hypothetical protein
MVVTVTATTTNGKELPTAQLEKDGSATTPDSWEGLSKVNLP